MVPDRPRTGPMVTCVRCHKGAQRADSFFDANGDLLCRSCYHQDEVQSAEDNLVDAKLRASGVRDYERPEIREMLKNARVCWRCGKEDVEVTGFTCSQVNERGTIGRRTTGIEYTCRNCGRSGAMDKRSGLWVIAGVPCAMGFAYESFIAFQAGSPWRAFGLLVAAALGGWMATDSLRRYAGWK